MIQPKSFILPILTAICVLVPKAAMAAGPGGISTDLELWLKVSSGAYTNFSATSPATASGDYVVRWDDQTSNNNNLVRVSGRNGARLLTGAGGINWNPTLLMTGSTVLRDITASLGSVGVNLSKDVFFIYESDDTAAEHGVIGFSDTTGAGLLGVNMGSRNSSGSKITTVTNVDVHSFNTTDGDTSTPHLYNIHNPSGILNFNLHQQYVDGEVTTGYGSGLAPNLGTTYLTVGADYNLAAFSNFASGRVAEIALYDTQLGSTDRNKIESYFALKYGITLHQSPTQDYIASDGTTLMWNSSLGGIYNNDIAGIGQDNNSGLLQGRSKSTNPDGIVSFSGSTADISNLEFLVWGNDNRDATTWTSSGTWTNAGMQRLTRVWQAQEENGDTGSGIISVDVDDPDLNLPSFSGSISLLYDTDNDDSLADEVPALMYDDGTNGDETASDGIWSASGINLASRREFTFATPSAAPVISNLNSSTTSSSATITFNTDIVGSTHINYGLTTSYGSGTTEINTTTPKTSHSQQITGLEDCTVYHAQTDSASLAGSRTYGADQTFTTGGCEGNASITQEVHTGIISNASGSGSTGIPGVISVSVPSGYLASNPVCGGTGAFFQFKVLGTGAVLGSTGQASGTTLLNTYELSAYCHSGYRVTSFDKAITVTWSYSDSKVSSLNENQLKVFRYNGSSWDNLSGCTVNTSANTVSCTTTQFSTFAAGGPASSGSGGGSGGSGGGSSGDGGGSSGGGGGGSGGREGKEGNKRIAAALQNLTLARAGKEQLTNKDVKADEPDCTAETLPHKNNQLTADTIDGVTVFTDVAVTAWYACHIHAITDRYKLASGYKHEDGSLTGEFRPEDPITLAETLRIAALLSKKNVLPGPPLHWSEPYEQYAKAMKLSVMTPDAQLHRPITRGMVIQVLAEYMNLNKGEITASYLDVPISHPYANAIYMATRHGWVQGDTDAGGITTRIFRPNENINRAEMAQIVNNIAKQNR